MSRPWVIAVVVVVSMTWLAAGCGRTAEAPPPAATSESATPAAATGDLNIVFTTDPNPPRRGENTIDVKVTDSTGAPVDDATVKAEFLMPAMPSMNMPAMKSEATLGHLDRGRYVGTGQLSMAGTWMTTIAVTRPGKDPVTKRLSVNAN